MKKISMIVIVVIVGLMLTNLPAYVFTIVSADTGESYPYQPTSVVIIRALGYLRNRQAIDGSIGGFSISAWAAMAISAAGEDPHNWGGLVAYLRDNVDRIDANTATDWERQTLAIVACDENPRDFDGIDYVAKIESFYDGVQIGDHANLYDNVFGILALIAGGVNKDSSMIQTVRAYIKEKQNGNGGWGDVDSTAAAVMALIAGGENPSSGCIKKALSFLKTTQTGNGGFQSWGTANAASTAWAVDAIVVAGEDPTSNEWKNDGESPVDFLLGLQQENGCFNWIVGQTMNPEWMTSYVVPALLGTPYPVKIYESDDGNNGSHASSWNGDIRIEGKTSTLWTGEVTVSNSTITALNSSSGEMEQYYILYPSVVGALDEASHQGGFSYFVIYYPSWHAFYVKTIANESDWWHYWVDYNLPMVDAGSYQLTDNDTEVLFGYLENWTAHALRITLSTTIVNESEKFTVSVFNETLVPVEDAEVHVDSLVYMTDKNGTAAIMISTPGYYDIYAEKNGYVRSEKKPILVNAKNSVQIIKPVNNTLYILNTKTNIQIQKILIIGHIDIEVKTSDDVEKVEFYVDGTLKYTDIKPPFTWRLDECAFFKKETLRVVAYISNDNVIRNIQNMIKYIDSCPENQNGILSERVLQSALKILETTLNRQSDFDEKEIIVFDFFPGVHIR